MANLDTKLDSNTADVELFRAVTEEVNSRIARLTGQRVPVQVIKSLFPEVRGKLQLDLYRRYTYRDLIERMVDQYIRHTQTPSSEEPRPNNPGIEQNASTSNKVVGGSMPSIVIAWDPLLISAEDYANLITAVGDVIRANGGAGLQFVKGTGFSVMADELVPA